MTRRSKAITGGERFHWYNYIFQIKVVIMLESVVEPEVWERVRRGSRRGSEVGSGGSGVQEGMEVSSTNSNFTSSLQALEGEDTCVVYVDLEDGRMEGEDQGDGMECHTSSTRWELREHKLWP